VKRRAIAALGELLFYIATPATPRNNNNKINNNNNNNSISNWKVPAFSIRLVERERGERERRQIQINRQLQSKTIG